MFEQQHILIKLLLVFMLSFSVVHSFVVEENHQPTKIHNTCTAEVNHNTHSDTNHNHLFHCEFHNVYILPNNRNFYFSERVYTLSSFIPNSYTYYHLNKLIKPPIA
jgi:hypothetical protein